MITPAIALPTDTWLGDGYLLKNYGETTERELGGVSGDSVFKVTREYRETPLNGLYGPTEDQKVLVRIIPVLTFGLLSLSATNLVDCFAGLEVQDEGTYHEITDSIEVINAHYHTNITYIGQRKDGKDIIVILEKALGDGSIEAAFKTKEDVILNTQFTAHFDKDYPTIAPWKIRYED